MQLLLHALVFVAGLAALIVGGNGLVRGATNFARLLGVSPLVVGLTVVAFGTSAPELAVSLTSGLSDYASLALGNVVGSNVFNLLLILGIATLFQSLPAERRLVRLDMMVLVVACLALWALSMDGTITRLEGAVLLASLLIYVTITVWLARKERQDTTSSPTEASDEPDSLERGDWMLTGIAMTLAGVTMVSNHITPLVGGALLAPLCAYLGLAHLSDKRGPNHLTSLLILCFSIAAVVMAARCMVEGAVAIARHFAIPEAVIGLTVVAAGTSLPEAVTTIAAGRQGQASLALGNVVGSNIFNVLCIVGVTGSVVELPVAATLLRFDMGFMVLTAVLTWLLLLRNQVMGKKTGIMYLLAFLAYIGVQLQRVT